MWTRVWVPMGQVRNHCTRVKSVWRLTGKETDWHFLVVLILESLHLKIYIFKLELIKVVVLCIYVLYIVLIADCIFLH